MFIRPATATDRAAVDALLMRSYPVLLARDYAPHELAAALPLWKEGHKPPAPRPPESGRSSVRAPAARPAGLRRARRRPPRERAAADGRRGRERPARRAEGAATAARGRGVGACTDELENS